jgi:hypothetical protein
MSERLKALKDGDWYDFHRNGLPKCPHCGEMFDIDENEEWRLYADGEHETECDKCGESFAVIVSATYTFSTDEQPDDDRL